MKNNVCVWDRSIRVVLGIVLIGTTVMGAIGTWGWIGVVPLVTGLVGFCPLYKMFGCKSCSVK